MKLSFFSDAKLESSLKHESRRENYGGIYNLCSVISIGKSIDDILICSIRTYLHAFQFIILYSFHFNYNMLFCFCAVVT